MKASYFGALLFLCLPFLGFAARGNFFDLNQLDLNFIASSLRVSLGASLMGMVIVAVIGLPAGYYLGRGHFFSKRIMDALFNLPQVLPPAVIGLLLLLTFGNNGLIGKYLPFNTSFTFFAVVLAFIVVALPLFIKGVGIAVSAVDEESLEAAIAEGATDWQAFRHITFPIIKNGLISSFLVAWSRGIAEFGATMMFAGNLQGVTQTLPLAIYSAMESNLNNALFLAFMMVAFSLLILVGTHLLFIKEE